MSFCEGCGKPLREGARFCGACGAVVPEDQVGSTVAADETPAEPVAWTCACGAENDPEALFCSHCGAKHEAAASVAAETQELPTAVTAVTAVVAAPQAGAEDTVELAVADVSETAGTEGAAGSGSRARFLQTLGSPWIIALIVAVVVIAIAVGAVFFVIHRSDHQKTSAAFDVQSQAIVTPLAPMVASINSGLPASLAACAWSTKLDSATSAAKRLQTALVQSQSACAKLSSTSPAQESTKQALSAALGRLGIYAQAVSDLPAQLSAVTSAQAQAVRNTGTDAQTACQQLRAAAPTLQPLTLRASTVLIAGARKASTDAALRLFLLKVQNDILNQAQYGRKDLVAAVAGVQGMTLNPDDAATTIDSVRANRQSLLDQLSAMNVPNDQRATKLYDLLQQSLQHSIEADRYFVNWMHGVYTYYYQPPQGYMGNVPFDDNYHKAVSQSSMAGVSKSRFCRAYNPIARRLGLRHTWKAGQI